MSQSQKQEGAIVRPALPEDLPQVLKLIYELAEFEKLTDIVEVNESKLTEAVFGTSAHVQLLVLDLEDQVIGYAMFFKTFSSFIGRPGFYLEDIYVQPQYRGQGYGRRFFAYIKDLIKEKNYRRMEWSVLDWNQKAIDFYKSLGAKELSEWRVYRLD